MKAVSEILIRKRLYTFLELVKEYCLSVDVTQVKLLMKDETIGEHLAVMAVLTTQNETNELIMGSCNNIQCYKCNRPNHMVRDCLNHWRESNKQEQHHNKSCIIFIPRM